VIQAVTCARSYRRLEPTSMLGQPSTVMRAIVRSLTRRAAASSAGVSMVMGLGPG
jgi:hypothetical protein